MGTGMSVSPQIWQQFVDLVFQDNLIKRKQNFDVIMDGTFIHSTAEEHMDGLMDLFKVLRKYGLKLSPHKCRFFKKKIVYMGLEFQVQGDKVCYTVRSNLTIHHSDTPFIIWQPIWRPCLLERVYKPIRIPHWCGNLWSLL